MKIVKLSIDAPGSSGTLLVACEDDEHEFLENLCESWNSGNPLHSQPYMTLYRATDDERAHVKKLLDTGG